MSDLSQRGAVSGVSTRSRALDDAELRSADDGATLTFTGYASVFDREYDVQDCWGEFKEQVAPGAFRASLAGGADVPLKLNHSGMTLARTKSGTMRLAEDTHGLHVEASLDPANPQVQALRSAMQRGDLDEMSFEFLTTSDDWSPDYMHRTVTGADIHKRDVSIVNYGANPYTSGAGLRSADIARALRSLDPREIDADVLAAIRALDVPNAGDSVSPSADADFYALRLRALS